MENSLPKGWAHVNLSLLVDYKKGKKPKRMENAPFKNSLAYLDIKAIEKKVDTIFVDAETSNATDEDQLVIVWDGARAGWVGKSRRGAVGSTLMALKPKIDRDYLFRFLQTQFDYLQDNHRGTGIPHVDPDIFWNISVPVAPLAEQQRIVAKLDELMEKIDRSRARLERIPKILKRFRQSILSAAVTGALTEKWRNSNRPNESALDYANRIKSSGSPIDLTTEGIPDTWINVQFGQVFEIVRGSSPRPKGDPRYFSKEKTPYHWIMLSDFTDNTSNNVLTTTNEYLTENGSKYGRYVNQNDILVGVSGVYGVGRTCLLDIEGYIYDGIMAIKGVHDACLRNFLNYFMQLQRMKLMDVATGTSWPNINTDILKKYICPIPPPNEQAEIIRNVELLLTVADKIEARYQKAKAHLDRMPQSLLAKAFRGELVIQDESDESAAELLKRILGGKKWGNKIRHLTDDYEAVERIAAEPAFKYKSTKR
jgi:type I restriction enzyme, S subunit